MNSKKFDNLLIISDIDGTLLSDDKTINKKNIEAIDYFIKNGGRFTLASGRSYSSIPNILEQVKVNAPCLCVNGSIIYDYQDKKILWEQQLDQAQAKPIVERIMKRFKTVGVEIFTGSGMCMVRSNKYTDIHIKRESMHYKASTLDGAMLPWYKVLICDHPEKLLEVEEFVIASGILQEYEGCRFVFTEDIFYELINKDTSKGNALKVLQQRFGFKFDKIYAIGDNYNDVEMINTADVGVGVKNAVTKLLDAADLVVCSNNDGAIYDLVNYIEKAK
jgi:Cof subfamily protein (haloacid dehalogenase superfamily)